jgi:hypothetical protein
MVKFFLPRRYGMILSPADMTAINEKVWRALLNTWEPALIPRGLF